MSRTGGQFKELVELIELQLEERISPQQFGRLESLVRADIANRRFYREYLDLHGMLHWDTAISEDSSCDPIEPSLATVETFASDSHARKSGRSFVSMASICVIVLVGAIAIVMNGNTEPDDEKIVRLPIDSVDTPDGGDDSHDILPRPRPETTPLRPVNLEPGREIVVERGADTDGIRVQDDQRDVSVEPVVVQTDRNSSGLFVAFINDQIRKGWVENQVEPSPKADDAEWIRRVFLDIVGHIPEPDQVRRFLADTSTGKREALVDELLDDEDFIRNSTTVWTNLLIGRSNPRNVNRAALQKYLREAFAENRGWDGIVRDFVAAEGSNSENGAVNFLLAHLNNQAVPATAITSKLFLGLQVQCTQCHDHPFNDKSQEEFWAFNSCFKQIEVRREPREDDPKTLDVHLLQIPFGGATFYENREGLMRAALPRFEDQRIGEDENVRRREKLAELMTTGARTQVADAYVNRVWEHFFGVAFTPAVDDMGPHAAVSHPELLDGISRAFVRSGYDTRRLIRWICTSEAYGLTSRQTEGNVVDRPADGETPLFSRVYVKPMSVEQLFDSLLIATQAREVFGSDWNAVERRRQQWLQQFVMAWGTDENDEANLFDGTIPQALMLMNSELIQLALDSQRGTYLDRVVRRRGTEQDKIEAIALATLSRPANSNEVAAVRRLIRDDIGRLPRGSDPNSAVRSSLQDLMWACLNSNEFILIH